jgi:hypothetical protein
MRRFLAVLVLTCLVPAAARAEEEAKTYDLHTWNATWKAGDVATVSHDDTSTQVLDITQPGQDGNEVTQKREQKQRDVWSVVVKCLEASPEGALQKALLFVADWTHTESATVDGQAEGEPKPDTSLKGLHLELTVRDGVHSHRILTPAAAPSPDGAAWLEKQYGAQQKAKWMLDLDHFGRPAGPVKVGDTWNGDPAHLDFPLPIDLKQSTLKLSLQSVADGRMGVGVSMRFKLNGFPLGGGPDAPLAPFTSGGMLEGDGTLTHSMAPHTFDGEGKFAGMLKGTAEIKGVVRVVMEIGHASEVRAKTGGEMPKPPETKPADAPK